MYNDFIGMIKPTCEMLYFISSLIVAYAAISALKQIRVMEKSISIQSKRDALKTSSDQCLYYMSEIIKLQNELSEEIDGKGVSFLKKWNVEVKGNDIQLKHEGPVDRQEFIKLLQCDFPKAFNPMEAFATYFVSKVADENIAFKTVGKTYVNTVEEYIPLLLHLSENGHYHNILQLYILWKNRFESIELQNQIQKNQKNLEKCMVKTIRPVGTDF